MANRLLASHCACCGRDREKKFFSKSLTTDELFPYCDTCINTKYRQNLAVVGMEEAALWLVCAQLDIPYINEYVKIAKKPIDEQTGAGRKIDFFRSYYNTLRDSGVATNKAFWASDVMLDDLIEVKKDIDDKSEDADSKRAQRKLDWGEYGDEDYEYLESLFEQYTNDVIISSMAQELMYRDLCKANLRKRVADASGDITEISKAQANIKDLLKSLKIDDFASGSQSEVEKHIERMAWMIENTKPAECEDLEQYKDFSGFEKPFGDIMRCVKNLVVSSREYPDIPREEK